MVAINNNIGEKFKILNSNSPTDKTDELFAELFAIINLDNLDNVSGAKNNLLKDLVVESTNPKVNLKNLDIENKQHIPDAKENKFVPNPDNNQNEIEVAKSLIEIFYKEIGIAESTNTAKNLTSTDLKGINNFLANKNSSNNHKIIHGNQETSKNFDSDIKQNQSQNFVVNIIKEPIQDKKSVKIEKNFKFQNEIKAQIDGKTQTNQIANKQIDSKPKTNPIQQSVLVNKKINKKNKQLKNISNEKIEGSEFLKKNVQNDSRIIISNQVKNQKLGDNQFNHKKEINNKSELKVNEAKDTQISNRGRDFLDLLESSWGEKFSKIIKNSINNGLNKLEIQIKPKNLGKLNLEVTVKNNTTSINIGSENQEVVSLLNDNLPKLLDLIDKESKGFSSLMNGENNQSNYFNDKKNKDDSFSNNQVSKKKKNTDNNKISNHNIDVNA